MLFVCYPKCSTCKKAKAWLDEKGIAYTLRDIKEDNPAEEGAFPGFKEAEYARITGK